MSILANEFCCKDLVQIYPDLLSGHAGPFSAIPSQVTLPDIMIKLGNDSLEPSQCDFGIKIYGETFST